jgi:hypothetical protein
VHGVVIDVQAVPVCGNTHLKLIAPPSSCGRDGVSGMEIKVRAEGVSGGDGREGRTLARSSVVRRGCIVRRGDIGAVAIIMQCMLRTMGVVFAVREARWREEVSSDGEHRSEWLLLTRR